MDKTLHWAAQVRMHDLKWGGAVGRSDWLEEKQTLGRKK